jgi:sugar transferase (PEP-CTERM/EpsH1 system associated)
MKILYVIPYVPSLIRVRPYNLIKHLSERGHEVTVLTLWSHQDEIEDLNRLREECYQVRSVHLSRARSMLNCLRAIPTRLPLQSVYCWQPELAGLLVALAHQPNGEPAYDILHIEHLRGVRYGLYYRSNKSNSDKRLPVVWDSVDSISLLFKQAAVQSKNWVSRWLTRFESRRTDQFERWLVDQFDHVLITSEQDKQAVLVGRPDQSGASSISVLPNGVDLDYFKPDERIMRDPTNLVISGKMSYHANVTMVHYFIREIMPLVWKHCPDVKVTVVGKDPPREIQALGQNPAIHITGTVKDIRPFLQKATISVVPILYGAGIQNKVLEAMACATPVVSTPQAVSALSTLPGRDVLVAQGSEQFARTVLDLLNDPAHQRQLGLAGRRYVEAYHHWDNIAAQLEKIYTQCIETLNGKSSFEMN